MNIEEGSIWYHKESNGRFAILILKKFENRTEYFDDHYKVLGNEGKLFIYSSTMIQDGYDFL